MSTLKLLFCFAVFSHANSLSAQDVELDVHKNKLGNFIALEQNYGSTKVANKSNYISGKGIAQPLIFRRKQSGLPDLLTYYFYLKMDSTISYVQYEWDDKNAIDYKENRILNDAGTLAFIEKYKSLYNQVHQKYGSSISKGNLDDFARIATGDFKKEDTWNPNDSTKIQLYTVLSGKYEKRGFVTINPWYVIRLYVYRIKPAQPDNPSQLSKEKIKRLDSIAGEFLSDLKNGDFEKSRAYLSASVLAGTSNEQLRTLAATVNMQNPVELYLSGGQIGADGSFSFMVQYRYANDTSNPPMETIQVIFDAADKIQGFRPLKRK